MSTFRTSGVVLSLNRALWGEVSSNLREVQFRMEDSIIEIRFFYDGEVTEPDKASIANVVAGVAADFPSCGIVEQIVRLDSGNPIPRGKPWMIVYSRRELTT